MAVVVGAAGAGRSESAIQLAAREADYRHAPPGGGWIPGFAHGEPGW